MENFLWNEPPMQVGHYLDPLSIYGFERLWGAKARKECLIHLLNSLFEGKKKVVDVMILPPKKNPSVFAPPSAISDLLCTPQSGARFFCELQCPLPPVFPGLAQWHSMDLFLDHGFRRVRHYRTSEVWVISFYAFQLPDIKPDQFISRYNLGGEDGHPEGPRFIFLEPAQFHLTADRIKSDLERWIYLLGHLTDWTEIPPVMRQGVFADLMGMAETKLLSPAEVLEYSRCLKEKEIYCDIWNKKLYRAQEPYVKFSPKRLHRKAPPLSIPKAKLKG